MLQKLKYYNVVEKDPFVLSIPHWQPFLGIRLSRPYSTAFHCYTLRFNNSREWEIYVFLVSHMIISD